MKYTKKQRKEIAQVLKLAKKLVWWGRNERIYSHQYICTALAEIAGRYPSKFDATVNARSMIAERLNHLVTVKDYLEFVVKVPKEELTRKAVQEFRHRWLDALIDEFSKAPK